LDDTITIIHSYIFSTPNILPRRAIDYIHGRYDSDEMITEYYKTNSNLCKFSCKIHKKMEEIRDGNLGFGTLVLNLCSYPCI
jgi:hypothetical protein